MTPCRRYPRGRVSRLNRSSRRRSWSPLVACRYPRPPARHRQHQRCHRGQRLQMRAWRSAPARRMRRSRLPVFSIASGGRSPIPSEGLRVRVHLINPSDVSFGTAVITPRWLFVLAAATPRKYGDPAIIDETLEHFDPDTVTAGDVVGVGVHTGNALRGYHVGRMARERGAFVIFGGIHATLFPDEVREHGQAHAVVTGDGDLVWP